MYYNFKDDVYDFVTLKDYKEFAKFVKSPENKWAYMFDDLGLWLRDYKPETYKKVKKEMESKYWKHLGDDNTPPERVTKQS